MSQFSRKHFSDTDIKDLIYQYKQYECLWNFNSPDYKCKSLKQDAWQEIADFFKKDVNEVKRKIKHLRSAYVVEKKKVNLSRKSGNETQYKPSLFYYTDLDFLGSIVVLRKCGNESDNDIEFESVNISPYTEENEETVSFANEEDIDFKDTEIRCKVEKFTQPEFQLSFAPKRRSSPKIVSSRSLSCQPLKRKIGRDHKLTKSVPANHSSCDRKSQFKNLYISFGKTIALQLQQMPLELAILAMSEIHVILTKKTLEHIKSLRKDQDSMSCSGSEYSIDDMIEEELDDSN